MVSLLQELRAKLSLDNSDFTAGIKKSSADISDFSKRTSDGISKARMSFTEMNSAIELVKGGIQLATQAYDAFVTPVIEYAEQVRDLGRISGESADSTSRLIQVSDDMKVSYETLTTAARIASKNGISLTTDSIAKLSDEYIALAPGAERAAFLIEKFGRSGLEMGKLLEKGGASIRKMSDEVDANLILTEDSIDQARVYEIELDNLGDSVDGLSMQIGLKLVPKITDFTKLIKELITLDADNWFKQGADASAEFINSFFYGKQFIDGVEVSLEEYNASLIDNAAAQSDVTDAAGDATEAIQAEKDAMSQVSEIVSGKLGDAIDDHNKKAKELQTETQNLRAELSLAIDQGWQPTSEKVVELKDKLHENLLKQRDLEKQIQETTKSLMFEKLAADMTAGAAASLARDLGLLDEPTAALIVGTDKIKEGLDTDKDGMISFAEYAAGNMTTQINSLTTTLMNNSGKTYSNDFITNLITREYYENYGQTQGISQASTGKKSKFVQGPGLASGGSFTVPSQYTNDSFPMRVDANERVSVSPKNDTTELLGVMRRIENLLASQKPLDIDQLGRTISTAVERTQR
jgi:hypothetical protein